MLCHAIYSKIFEVAIFKMKYCFFSFLLQNTHNFSKSVSSRRMGKKGGLLGNLFFLSKMKKSLEYGDKIKSIYTNVL
jgi:hypothetical protein